MEIFSHFPHSPSRRLHTSLTSWLLASALLGGCQIATDHWEPSTEQTPPSAIESQASSSLEILSEPPGAEWFIDEKPQGTTPGKALDLSPGPHQITIKKPGFRNWSVSTQINPGETMHLVAPLQPSGAETLLALAKMAESYMHERRFTSPKGANALETYQEILTMDPKNPLGWEGLRQIVASFQKLSKEAATSGQPKLAAVRAQKAQRIQTLIDNLNADQKNAPVTPSLPSPAKQEQKTTTKTPDKTAEPAPIQERPTQTEPIPLAKRPVPPKPTPISKSLLEAQIRQASATANAPKKEPLQNASSQPEPSVPQPPETTLPPPTPSAPEPNKKSTVLPPSANTPIATPKVTPKEQSLTSLRTQVEPVTGIEFIEIPAGCFKMGSDQNDADEQPVHEVCLKSFWLARTEVTNGQYRRFKPKHSSTTYAGRNLNGELQPVVNVTWADANQFAQWMSGRGGVNFRLPTEAEWEYAARAGSTTHFPWGNDPNEGCRYANVGDATAKKEWPKWNVFSCTDGYAETAPVGMFLPNTFGLYDMIGNVWEWVSDWYSPSYYSTATKENNQGPSEGFFRSARGGSWAVWPDYARSSNRTGIDPDHPDLHVGFRLVMMP